MARDIGSIVQYVVLACVAYVLIGSPIQSILFGTKNAVDEADHSSFDGVGRLIIPNEDITCPEHKYSTHILNRDPLVIYISDFLTYKEARHLVDISEAHFEPSTVWTGQEERLDPAVRVSEKAQLDESDVTVQCIAERAREFQGWRPYTYVEKLWSQRYRPGGHYAHHFDGSPAVGKGGGRISSFMVYLDANCTGGGTEFPRLRRPIEPKWCEFIECPDENIEGDDDGMGITFKAVAGNAVYWENFGADGKGYDEVFHAGLPVKTGTKIGLNIWNWWQPGWTPAEPDRNEVKVATASSDL